MKRSNLSNLQRLSSTMAESQGLQEAKASRQLAQLLRKEEERLSEEIDALIKTEHHG